MWRSISARLCVHDLKCASTDERRDVPQCETWEPHCVNLVKHPITQEIKSSWSLIMALKSTLVAAAFAAVTSLSFAGSANALPAVPNGVNVDQSSQLEQVHYR